MHELIELAELDLRYEGCSLKDPAREKRLLNSILENGIREPLQGIDGCEGKILFDGFKRPALRSKTGHRDRAVAAAWQTTR